MSTPSRDVQRLLEAGGSALDEVKPVVKGTKVVEVLNCPHCGNEILEKHSYDDGGGVTRHSDCGGAFTWPPTDWSKIDPSWAELLRPHVK